MLIICLNFYTTHEACGDALIRNDEQRIVKE